VSSCPYQGDQISVNDVMILKIFSPKNGGFFCSNYREFCKNFIVTLVFEKNASFFAEKWQKSQKIVSKTSTPDVSYLLKFV
jgi:hypothetical protein